MGFQFPRFHRTFYPPLSFCEYFPFQIQVNSVKCQVPSTQVLKCSSALAS